MEQASGDAILEALGGNVGLVIDLFWISPRAIPMNEKLVRGLQLPDGWTAHHVEGFGNGVELTMVSLPDEAVAALRAGESEGVAWKPVRVAHLSAPRGRAASGRVRAWRLDRAAVRSGPHPDYQGTTLAIWGERKGGRQPVVAICEDTPGNRTSLPRLVGGLPTTLVSVWGEGGSPARWVDIPGGEALAWELGRKGLGPLIADVPA